MRPISLQNLWKKIVSLVTSKKNFKSCWWPHTSLLTHTYLPTFLPLSSSFFSPSKTDSSQPQVLGWSHAQVKYELLLLQEVFNSQVLFTYTFFAWKIITFQPLTTHHKNHQPWFHIDKTSNSKKINLKRRIYLLIIFLKLLNFPWSIIDIIVTWVVKLFRV